MNEILKDIINIYKEKTKLPIVSSYIFLMLIWNWDLISIYLFSEMIIEDRIVYIKELSNENYSKIFRFFIPLSLAILYPILSNYLMYFIDSFTKNPKNKRTEIIYERKLIRATKEFLIEEEKTGKRTLEDLRLQIKTINTEHDNLLKDKDKLLNDLSDSQLEASHFSNELSRIMSNKDIRNNHLLYLMVLDGPTYKNNRIKERSIEEINNIYKNKHPNFKKILNSFFSGNNIANFKNTDEKHFDLFIDLYRDNLISITLENNIPDSNFTLTQKGIKFMIFLEEN